MRSRTWSENSGGSAALLLAVVSIAVFFIAVDHQPAFKELPYKPTEAARDPFVGYWSDVADPLELVNDLEIDRLTGPDYWYGSRPRVSDLLAIISYVEFSARSRAPHGEPAVAISSLLAAARADRLWIAGIGVLERDCTIQEPDLAGRGGGRVCNSSKGEELARALDSSVAKLAAAFDASAAVDPSFDELVSGSLRFNCWVGPYLAWARRNRVPVTAVPTMGRSDPGMYADPRIRCGSGVPPTPITGHPQGVNVAPDKP